MPRKRRKRLGRPRTVAPRSVEEFLNQPPAIQTTWSKITSTVTRVRRGDSLSKAAKELGIDPRTVAKRAGKALRRLPNGRYAATRTDSLLRVLRVPTENGIENIALKSSRQASLLGSYWDAVQRYLRSGDDGPLMVFRGKTIQDTTRGRIELIADKRLLNRLGAAGVFSFESLYARAA